MAFSTEWDDCYRDLKYVGSWPWTDLVSGVMLHAKPTGPQFRVLELGCGAGTNIPFFRALDVEYFAIDGSATIVELLRTRFPELADRIVVGDFTEAIPFPGTFDLIVDRSALTFNPTASIRRALAAIRERLAAGGRFIGIDWYATDHSDFHGAATVPGDPFTVEALATGHLAGTGRVHFADEAHLRELFAAYRIIALDHKRLERIVPVPGCVATWNIVAERA